ncbi:MAG: DHHW family protein [Clostridia bacterium]|nr:DHHW family protein [Clostridia bacterium]
MTNNTGKNENAIRKKKRITAVCAVTSAVFFVIVFGILVLAIATPDKEKSESENRVLKKFPAFSISAVTDGSFMKNFETYFNDQFPLRDKLIAFKTKFERSLGKTEENGVYIGKDNFLFEAPTKPDEEKIKELTDAITAFSQKNKKLKKAFILSPNATDIIPEKLPKGLKIEDRSENFKTIQKSLSNFSWVDCKASFEKYDKKDTLFYRTDHHWTTRGAYLAFKGLSDEWKLGAKGKDYSFFTVSDSFQGTLSSSSAVGDATDKIEICVPKKEAGKYTVLYESSGRKTATLFEEEKLNQKNQYEVFLGGNYDKVVITTTAETTATLLVFKDSYANCLLPMLTPYFSKIVVIDPRYFSDSLKGIMGETQFTHVLFVYNMDTFLGDSSLAAALES